MKGHRIRREAPLYAAILVIGALLTILFPGGLRVTSAPNGDAAPITEIVSGSVWITELMTSNTRWVGDGAGQSPDWVEIGNVGTKPVSVSGWYMSRTDDPARAFAFPDRTLAPGEYILVYCDRGDADIDGLHAPFRLSQTGDTLLLFNAAGAAVHSVNIPALARNTAYAFDGVAWHATEQASPGFPNTDLDCARFTQSSGGDVRLIFAETAQPTGTSTTERFDRLCLRNDGAAPIDLGGWFLSDDVRQIWQWRLPKDCVLAPGETLTVYCSGQNRAEARTNLHTNFRLSAAGETVLLADANGCLVDLVTIPPLSAGEVYARQSDGAWLAIPSS